MLNTVVIFFFNLGQPLAHKMTTLSVHVNFSDVSGFHIERLLLNHAKTREDILGPGGEEFNPGPETRLDHSELCVIKFY